MSELAPIRRLLHPYSPSAACALVQNDRKHLLVRLGSKLMKSFALRAPLPTRICALMHDLIEASLESL